MRRLMRLIQDKNGDLIFLSCLSVLLLGVQLWNKQWVSALFAGTLGSFAISLMRIRGQFAPPVGGVASAFLDVTPSDLPKDFERARDLLLSGVSLDRTIRNSYSYLEAFLAKGGKLRVLLVNPDCEAAVQMADRRAYLEHGVAQRRQHILLHF